MSCECHAVNVKLNHGHKSRLIVAKSGLVLTFFNTAMTFLAIYPEEESSCPAV